MVLEFPRVPAVKLFEGGCKTGKTQKLALEVAALLDQGVSAEDILVVVAQPEAVEPTRRLLAFSSQGASQFVGVRTARELAMSVLATPGACAATGRKPRQLARYEESFLMEDMKVSGLRPKRIAELTGFFYRSWTELADFEEGWLIYKEEEENHAQLKRLLGLYGAYIEPEISNMAFRFLSECPAELAKAQFKYVFADDYQMLSRASQYLVCALAGEKLFAAGNPLACVQVFDSFPYAKGIDELKAQVPQADVVMLSESHLPTDTAAAVGSLSELAAEHPDFEGMEIPVTMANGTQVDGGFEIIETATPAEECERVIEWVQARLSEGLSPEDVAVVVPNKTWELNVLVRLLDRGVAASSVGTRGNIGGDVRFEKSCLPAQTACLLTLAADPGDEPSLRAWCGFGDELTCRSAFTEVYTCMESVGLSMDEALAVLSRSLQGGDLPEGVAPVVYGNEMRKAADRYELLQEHLEHLRPLEGYMLKSAATKLVCGPAASVGSTIDDLFSEDMFDESAAAMLKNAHANMFYPATHPIPYVKVVTRERVIGMNPKAVVFMGMVNGLSPKHAYFDRTKTSPEQARKMLAGDARIYMAALSKGMQRAAMTYFTTARGTDAERQGLRVERFYAQDGERHARLSKSLVLNCIKGEDIPEVYF
ncbi:Uncharacterised protein [Slackia heliotrinireducens]|uniref:DNA helicase n=1 Tax=Slackia heliotrinireducens (strain ATCC 29202 / DSM 20476 / NCTC 11029 / RHS 1) TaxID=471855 RepID=C7N165_SLAHD|nr:hypothetical protein [Slackia heliotrinireducens]ACV23287.1 hypothetical protein Shel_22770 [Slackia heliotrinireducens DSM 20476]VEH02462.1 Uncharacterised protein [Slackia heliotrinireducens]